MNETFYSDNDYRLYHYGRLGMHWGVKNGPPYPLDGKKRAQMKKEALSDEDREKAIRKSDMKTIRNHSDEFSNKELQEAVNRLNLKKQVRKAAAGKTPYENMDDTMKKVAKATGWIATGTAAYAAFRKLYNSVNGSSVLPGIQTVLELNDYKWLL